MAGSTGSTEESPGTPEQWAILTSPPAASPARSLSERMNYPSFTGIVVTTLLIVVPFIGLFALVVDVVMVLRYVFGYRAPGSPQWSVHHPSVTSLVIVWVVALFTLVAYPLAFYMTWRFVLELRERKRAGSKACPRCAETVKAAALVCRHCGKEFDMSAYQTGAGTIADPRRGPLAPERPASSLPSEPSKPGGRNLLYVLVGLGAVAVTGFFALIFLGSQIGATAPRSVSYPPCVIVMDGPLGRLEAYIPGATAAQCNAELASARENFGPDSSSSKLYIVNDVPSGTPACVVGITQMFAYGLTSDAVAAQICP